MNVIPDLVERAPRMDGETEQILLRFLGVEPHARCDLREKMFQVRVHFEHLPSFCLMIDGLFTMARSLSCLSTTICCCWSALARLTTESAFSKTAANVTLLGPMG